MRTRPRDDRSESVLALEQQAAVPVEDAPLMRELHHLFAYRTLIKYLVLKEIKVKSRGTFFGVAWTLMNPAVASAIVGARTQEHLTDLDRAAALQLEPAHLDKLNELFRINRGRPLRSGEAPHAFAW